MVRVAIGVILIIAASVVAIVLFTGGGPILPHIVGPIVLAVIGVTLLLLKRKVNKTTDVEG